LIKQLHKKTKEQVVILVDEYDKPITENLGNTEIVDSNKRILHDFYQVLKGSDEHLRFVFLTGVSKFSGLSVFSALNSIDDITLDEQYAAICGYTHEELEENFKEYIEIIAQDFNVPFSEMIEGIKKWYNGFSWDGKTMVYNSFSTLIFLRKKVFRYFWYETATPTFLLELVKKYNRPQEVIDGVTVDFDAFESYDTNNLDMLPLLFQTGYLTVKAKEKPMFEQPVRYTLGYPNEEVKKSFTKDLFYCYANVSETNIYTQFNTVKMQLKNADAKGLENSLNSLFASVPYQLDNKKNEAYYHSLFYVWLKTLGFEINSEVSVRDGRIDAVLKEKNETVIVEIKYGVRRKIQTMLKEAMRQIHDKKYYEPYLEQKSGGRNLLLLGIAFNGKDIACEMKEV